MKAALIFRRKVMYGDGRIIEAVIWRLPRKTIDRPHGYKYRLYYGYPGECLVRYDNETAKGDYRHLDGAEFPYHFVSLRELLYDFNADVKARGG